MTCAAREMRSLQRVFGGAWSPRRGAAVAPFAHRPRRFNITKIAAKMRAHLSAQHPLVYTVLG